MIYLDHNATTPLAPEARDAMLPFLGDQFGNASSIHVAGRRARAAVDDARDGLAHLLGAKPHEIIFTSGGTEASNLAIIGLARANAGRGRHLITAATEHHAVLHAFEFLKKYENFEVTILPVDSHGVTTPEALRDALREDTVMASIMSANNETGARQPIREMAAICKDVGVLFHTDAVQTFGKERILPHEMGIDALSIAAHKFYGPQGAGALFLRAGLSVSPVTVGGAQENQRRAGTENVAAIVGMRAAAAWACTGMEAAATRHLSLREDLWEGIRRICPAAVRNGEAGQCLPNTLNISFPDADGEMLIFGLDLEGVCVSSGSACMVGSVQASHVLLAMSLPTDLASTAVRFSLGRATSQADVDAAIAAFERVWSRMTALDTYG